MKRKFAEPDSLPDNESIKKVTLYQNLWLKLNIDEKLHFVHDPLIPLNRFVKVEKTLSSSVVVLFS